MGPILKVAGNVVTGAVNSMTPQLMGAATAGILGGKKGLQSYINSVTQGGLTGEQEALQALEDSKYQRTVEDMKRAGINPAAAGQMSGDGTVSPSNQAVVPNEDLLSGLSKIQQNKLVKAQEKAQAIQNVYALEKEYQELQGLILDNEEKGIDNSDARLRLHILEQTIGEQIEAYHLGNAKTRAEIRKSKAEAKNQEIRNKYQDILSQLEVAEGEQSLMLGLENIKLLKSQVREKDSLSDLNEYELMFKKATQEDQQQLLKAQVALNKAQRAYVSSQTDLNRQELKLAETTFSDVVAQTAQRTLQERERTSQEEQRTLQEGERTKQSMKDTKYYESNRNWDHWTKVGDSVIKAAGLAVGISTGSAVAGKAAGTAVKGAAKASKGTFMKGPDPNSYYPDAWENMNY